MKVFKQKKLFVFAIGFLAMAAIGVTLAFFTAKDETKNTIQMGKIKVDVSETVIEGKKTDVGVIVKEGSVPCWVRIFVELPIGMQQQTLVETVPIQNELGPNWTKSGNYYYYNLPLGGKSTDETVILFDEIKSLQKLEKDQIQKELDIIVYAEAIQKEFGDSSIQAYENIKKK
ncbi:MAG: SipW-dependent-type signal peptide-containing protein [Lachnospiraceae bacterium]